MLAGAVDSHAHVFVADVVKSFDTVEDRSLAVLVCLPGFVMLTLSTMRMFALCSSLLLALVSLGHVMGVFLRGAL